MLVSYKKVAAFTRDSLIKKKNLVISFADIRNPG